VHLVRLRFVLGRFHDHHEFVTADTADDVRAAQGLPQALRHLAQQHVANIVAQRVVDDLEVVEIEQQHADAGLLAVRALQRVRQLVVEGIPVGQASYGIDVRQQVQVLLR